MHTCKDHLQFCASGLMNPEYLPPSSSYVSSSWIHIFKAIPWWIRVWKIGMLQVATCMGESQGSPNNTYRAVALSISYVKCSTSPVKALVSLLSAEWAHGPHHTEWSMKKHISPDTCSVKYSQYMIQPVKSRHGCPFHWLLRIFIHKHLT